MKVLVALLGLCFASLAPAGARADTGPGPQPLSISVRGDGAQATRLPAYDPTLPIAVTVTHRDAEPIDALSVAAVGPAGTMINVPLVRSAQGTFSGTLTLTDQGKWRLRLISRSGPLSTGTTPISLDVAAPPPSNANWIGWAVGSGIFLVVGGGGFLILRRLVRAPAAAAVASVPARTASVPATTASTAAPANASAASAAASMAANQPAEISARTTAAA